MASNFSDIKTSQKPAVFKFFAAGAWTSSATDKFIEIHSPIDNAIVGIVPSVTKEEAEMAVESAKNAQKGWEGMLIHERVDLLHKTAGLIRDNVDLLRDLIILEIGKPFSEAEDEVLRTVDLIDYYAEEGRRLVGDVWESSAFPGYKKNKVAIARRVPLGVVLAIPPFNYPINEGAPKIVAALVSGNTVILKPSTQGTISSLHMVELFRQAGLPDGVLNCVTGKGEDIGDFLVTHPLIDAINLTGSFETADEVAHKAGMKKLLFGLSGKDASIVLADADLVQAADEIAKGSFSYGGQRCTGIKRVLVEEKCHDEFVELLKKSVSKKYILGDPRIKENTLGPIINDRTAGYIAELLEDAVNMGAKVVLGGKREGRNMEATILTEVTKKMRLAWEEPFGPILPVLKVASWEEAVATANQSEYGLQSSVFTKDIDKAWAVAEALEVGSIQINGKDARGPDHFPFTGFKHSGLGMVQGAKYLISEMTRYKTIVMNTKG
ncbi:aldehyde dehydrogenase family protein [Candidatus Gottesmanbacteria bacterium]|nr:aldehyde dehydrogenase family protein [Candidatus Gottesmanbacteria bacterium]